MWHLLAWVTSPFLNNIYDPDTVYVTASLFLSLSPPLSTHCLEESQLFLTLSISGVHLLRQSLGILATFLISTSIFYIYLRNSGYSLKKRDNYSYPPLVSLMILSCVAAH